VIYELNHFGIVVRNLDASLKFYQQILGARVVYQGFIPASRTDVVYLLISGGLIELLHAAEPAPDTQFGITHVAFLSDDLDADYDRLIRAGCEGIVAPKVAGTGVGRLAFLNDPNGARVELIQRDVAMRDTPAVHPIVRSFDHYSVVADNLDAAMAIYRDLMGMKLLKTMEVPHPTNPLSITYLHYGYDVLELLHRPTPDGAGDIFGHFALRVDSVDAALEAFAAQGIPTEPGMPKKAGNGFGRIGMIRDPDGVKVELVDRVDLRELP
jgi:catechol 2,3-dioxygenase-like lactoylglutathione lyase family enzyme